MFGNKRKNSKLDKNDVTLKILDAHLEIIKSQENMLDKLFENAKDVNQIIRDQKEAINKLEKQMEELKKFTKVEP